MLCKNVFSQHSNCQNKLKVKCTTRPAIVQRVTEKTNIDIIQPWRIGHVTRTSCIQTNVTHILNAITGVGSTHDIT